MSPPAKARTQAAVKAFTECLAHELREASPLMDCALLVPGWVHTKLTNQKEGAPKPDGAWTPEQTVDYMLERLEDSKTFYIICPDNECTPEMDKARMTWSTNDLLQNRPALSRWHKDYKEAFEQYMKG
jgi:short-subunit dehydrogenase